MTTEPIPPQQQAQSMARWKDDEASLLGMLDELEQKHGYVPRDVADELARILEVKLERLTKIRTKIESGTRKDVEEHVKRWAKEEGNLIMILHAIQNEHGYVPREVAMELSRALDVKLARIYEVITFYHYFKLVPPGKHNVAVRMFHLDVVRCIGCCGLSPAMVVDGKTYGKVKPTDISQIIIETRKKDEQP
jgi:NADH-quinone oxidoreductase subunit E